jgi:DNA polymerase-3 subunit delta
VSKLPPARIDSFLKAPDRVVRAALIYGPDGGRVRERAELLARAISDDPKDAFRVAELAPAALGDDPDLLAAEFGQMNMFGGRRLIRVREAGDALGALFQRFFKTKPPGDGFVLVEAGDLSSRSPLRRAFETPSDAVAIACYADNARDLQVLVREVMASHRVRVEEDAAAYLVDHLGGDRALSRGELEKLALYAGDGGAVTLADAAASVGDSAGVAIEDAVLAAAEGDLVMVERALDRMFAEGENPVTVLRAAQRYVTRLHLAAAHREGGMNDDEALRALRPPPFFKVMDRMRLQLRYWPARRARAALGLLLEAELNTKRSGPPPEAMCRDALLRIARRVAQDRR